MASYLRDRLPSSCFCFHCWTCVVDICRMSSLGMDPLCIPRFTGAGFGPITVFRPMRTILYDYYILQMRTHPITINLTREIDGRVSRQRLNVHNLTRHQHSAPSCSHIFTTMTLNTMRSGRGYGKARSNHTHEPCLSASLSSSSTALFAMPSIVAQEVARGISRSTLTRTTLASKLGPSPCPP
jgi:hypothetical protein